MAFARSQIASSLSSSSSSPSSNLSSRLESSLILEEETTTTNNNNNNNFGPPWLGLPDHLTEKILERLPLSDYIRFGAVCPQWLSIQENHRRRHAPSPPPMLNLPWFIPREPQPQQEPVDVLSLFGQRSHRIRLPLSRRYLERGIESSGRYWSSYLPGWLVLCDGRSYGSYCFTLLNPISGVQIELPVVGNSLYLRWKLTMSPPPGCLVFLMTDDKWNLHIHLLREGDDYWSELEFPDDNMRWDSASKETCAIVWEGKVYYMYLGRGLMVIDPGPPSSDPTIEFLEMDQSQLPQLRRRWEDDVFHEVELFMVESNGKMLLVMEFFETDDSTTNARRLVVGFQVFEADFSNKRWVRLESLGHQVLFVHHEFVCSLLADDIGAEWNCIYCPDPYKMEEESCRQNSSTSVGGPWTIFNLGTGKLTESSLSYAPSPDTHLMFMPSARFGVLPERNGGRLAMAELKC